MGNCLPWISRKHGVPAIVLYGMTILVYKYIYIAMAMAMAIGFCIDYVPIFSGDYVQGIVSCEYGLSWCRLSMYIYIFIYLNKNK